MPTFNLNKKNVIIGGLILITLILIGTIIYQSFIFKPLEIPKPISLPPPIPGTLIEEDVFSVEFKQCQAVDYDKTPNYGKNRNDIFYKIAEIAATKNEKECLKLEGEEQNICLTHYARLLSLKENDTSYLKKLGENLPVSRAFSKENIRYCQEFSDDLVKAICQSIVSLDKKYCNFSQEKILTESYLSLSESEIKREKREIDKETATSWCLNFYYLAKALKEKNIKECSKIDYLTGRFTRLYCLALLSPNPKETINQFYRENACYEKYATLIAHSQKDPSICEKIPLKDTSNKKIYEECIAIK